MRQEILFHIHWYDSPLLASRFPVFPVRNEKVRRGRGEKGGGGEAAIPRYGLWVIALSASFQSFSSSGGSSLSKATPASIARISRREAWRRPAMSASVAAISLVPG